MMYPCLSQTKPEPAPAGEGILLAEDDEDIAGLIQRALQRMGYHIIPVESGPDALERARTHRPDCALVKEVLPGLNGRSVAARMAAEEETRKIPVILYDDTLSPERQAAPRRAVPPTVKSYLNTSEAARLVEAVQGVLRSQATTDGS